MFVLVFIAYYFLSKITQRLNLISRMFQLTSFFVDISK